MTEKIPNRISHGAEKSLKPSTYNDLSFATELLFPEILPEEKMTIKKKWQNIDIAALEDEDPKFKEFSEDKRRLNEKLGEFIKQKSHQEILDRARDVYIKHLNEGAVADSVDNLMRSYHKAYEVARIFLTKDLMEEAGRSCLDMLWRRINEADIDDQKKTQLINSILSLKRWFPDISINLGKSPEKAGKILSFLLVGSSLTDGGKEELFNNLIATRKIKVKGEDGKTKTKKIIVGRNLLSRSAKEELRSLNESGGKEQVLAAANFLEEKCILNLTEDAEFFETMTGKEQ